jgi:predicted Zn finger-like uncharacterized protein
VVMRSAKVSDLEHTHSIIQCPQCQTKFAVEKTSIQHLDAPRFHCSRCDSVFAFDAKPKLPKHSIAESNPEQTTAAKFEPNEQAAKISTEEGAHSSFTEASETIVRSRGLAPETDWELPRSLAISTSAQRQANPHVPSPTTEATQIGFNFGGASAVGNAALQQDRHSNDPDLKRFEATPFPTEAQLRPRTGLSRWTSFAYLAAPLLFFVSGVLGTSAYLNQNASQGENLVLSISPNLPQIPPVEVSIEETGFRRAALDSGEVVYLVSGTLINNSEETFKDVQLEGLGFDSRGGLVSRTKIDAGATLAKTRIRSLSISMIEELQSGKIRSKQELKPGQSQEFTFALLDGKPELASYFSARVYSVSKN